MYGWMMPGHYSYPEIDELVAETTPDAVAGRLFDSGAGYPAAVVDESGKDMISGYVLRFLPERAAEANAIIADTENNLFRPTRVQTASGTSAIAYEWVGATSDLAHLPNGNWDRSLEPSREPSPASEISDFGDDTRLDALASQCEAGNWEACDDLYRRSPAGSAYEDYGSTCGGRFD